MNVFVFVVKEAAECSFVERSVVASDLRATVFAVGVARFNLRATRTTAVDRGLDGCVRGVLDLATAATVDVWLRNVGNVVLGMTVLASDQTHAHDSITIATNPKFRLARRCRLDAERSRKAVHCLMGLSSHCLDRKPRGAGNTYRERPTHVQVNGKSEAFC